MKKFCFHCCNNKNLSKTHPVSNIKTCGICLQEKKDLQNYPCNSCTEDSWMICSDCLVKCSDKNVNHTSELCPVCRTKRIDVEVESQSKVLPSDYDSEINQNIKPEEYIINIKCYNRVIQCGCKDNDDDNNDNNNNNDFHNNNDNDCDINYICSLIFFFIKLIAMGISFTMIGAIFPFMICNGNCNSNSDLRCYIGSILTGIFLAIIITLLFVSKKSVDDSKRFIIGIVGAIILVLTLSFRTNNLMEPIVFLLLIPFIPMCVYCSTRSIEGC